MVESYPQGSSEAGNRRSTRIQISVPVIITGIDASGRPFKESTRTLVINQHGGKIATFHQLDLGTEITIENRRLGLTARAGVVWLGERRSLKEPAQIGIQLFEAQNIWGVEFTPEDWQKIQPSRVELKPTASIGEQAEKSASGDIMATKVSPSEAPATESGVQPPVGAKATASSDAAPAMAASAEARLKDFEDRLRALAEHVGAEAEATIQAAAVGIEERLTSAAEVQLQTILEKIEGTRQQADSLLAQAREIRAAAQQEIEKVRTEIGAARKQILEEIERESKERILAIWEPAAADATRNMGNTFEQLIKDALGRLDREAVERLNQMMEGRQASMTSTLQSQADLALKDAENQLHSMAQAVTSQWNSSFEKSAEQIGNALRTQLEKELRDAAERMMGEMVRSVKERTQAALGEIESGLKAPLQKIREQVQSEIDGADLRARKYCEQEVERADRMADAHLDTRIEKFKEILNQAADQTRSKAQETTERILQDFRSQAMVVSQTVLEGLKEQASGVASGSMHHLETESGKVLAGRMAKAQEEFLSSAMPALAEKLKASQRNTIEEARKYIVAFGKSTIESLNKEAGAGLDHYRQELQRLAAQEAAEMAERLRQERDAALKEAQEVFRTTIAQMFTSLGSATKKEAPR